VIRSESTVAIVMEFVDGTPLRRLCGAPVTEIRLVPIGCQIARALAAAHAGGIVHRDIKPENVILRPDGSLKVLDFGLARWVAPQGEQGSWVSGAGMVTGTWRYMSPEQVKGEKVTGASDVFALGLVLYELCAGRHPFPVESPFEVLQEIVSGVPDPPSKWNPAISRPLESLILAMLSKEPSARPSAQAVNERLSELERTSTFPGIPATGRLPRRYAYGAAALLATTVLAAGVALFWGRRPPAAPPVDFYQVTTLVSENRATAAAISPDGSRSVYANTDGLFVRAMKNGQTNALRGPVDLIVNKLAWFADGTGLVASGFSATTNVFSVWSVSVTNASPRLLRSNAQEGIPSPEGTRIAFTGSGHEAIWVMGIDGEEPRRVVAGPQGDTFPLVLWSADGRRLSFQRRHFSGRQDLGFVMLDRFYERSYESVDVKTGRVTARVPNLWINSAAFLPDNRLFFLRYNPPGNDFSNELWEVKTDAATGAFLAPPFKVADPIGQTGDRIFGLSATADGKQTMVLRRSDQQSVFVADFVPRPPRVTNVRRLTLDERSNYPHAWTADSRAVIFESDRNGTFDIFKQHLDQRSPDVIAGNPKRWEVMPQLSPDGRSLLYAEGREGAHPRPFTLMRVLIDGGAAEEVPIGGPLDEFRCGFGPGRRCVLRTTVNRAQFVFYELEPVRGKGRELARTSWVPAIVGDWSLSPDGAMVAIPIHDERSAPIRFIPMDGGPKVREREVVLPGMTDLSAVTWAASGQNLFVTVINPLGNRVLFVSLDGRWRPIQGIQGRIVAAPDGRHVAFLNPIAATNAWIMQRR
jgi:hypothetical protein